MKQCQTRNSNLSLVINSYIKLQYSPHHSLIKRLHCVTSFNQYLLKVLFLKVDIIDILPQLFNTPFLEYTLLLLYSIHTTDTIL